MIRRIWYSAAAVVVIAIIFSIWVFKPFSGLDGKEIYAQYNKPFQTTDAVMELARADNDFLFAVEVYEAGDYERAAILLNMLSDSSGSQQWSGIYAGSAYMLSNQTEKAISVFLKIIDESGKTANNEILYAAQWQLALCYIKTGEPGKAKELLISLKNSHGYRKDANRILRLIR